MIRPMNYTQVFCYFLIMLFVSLIRQFSLVFTIINLLVTCFVLVATSQHRKTVRNHGKSDSF